MNSPGLYDGLSVLGTETLTPPPLTPGGLDRDPHSQAVSSDSREEPWLLGLSHGCYFFSANHGQGSSFLQDTVLRTPRDPCNNDNHTVGWEAQRDNGLAPPGHTASKWSWTPAQHTFLTRRHYHWSSLSPPWSDPRVPRVTAPFAWPPSKLLSEPEGVPA